MGCPCVRLCEMLGARDLNDALLARVVFRDD